MKQTKWRYLTYFSLYDFEGSPDKVIVFLQNLKKQYKGKELELEVDCGYVSDSLILKFKDLETDKEESNRLIRKKSIEADERHTLKLLKDRYE